MAGDDAAVTDRPRVPLVVADGSASAEADVRLEDIVGDFATRYRTIGQSVVEILRQAIVRGALAPGQRLPQEDLARRMGVSRAPVRTALMELQAEGLVVFEPHRGATVRTSNADRVRETFSLRILLETAALREAAATWRLRDPAALIAEARELDRAHGHADFLQRRVVFYRMLYDADRRPVTMGVIEHLRTLLGRHRLGIRVPQHDFSHEALARAVTADDDVEAAVAMLRTHLNQVCEAMVAGLATADHAAPPAR